MVDARDHNSDELIIASASAQGTQAVARRLAAMLRPGDLVALNGPLGAGKTCFVQGLGEGLGIEGPVTSPTFVVMRLHDGSPPLCHVDAYRIEDGMELIELGLHDLLEEAVVAIEWANRVADALPEDRLEVAMRYDGDGRELRLTGHGSRAAAMIERMRET